MKLLQGSRRYYILLVVLFFVIVFALPASSEAVKQYHISAAQYHFLLFLVELPLAIIWFIALFGYERLKRYSKYVKGSKEEPGYLLLTKGSKWLAIGLIVPAFVSLFFSAITNKYPGLSSLNKILINYMTLVFAAIAYLSISQGTQKLMQYAKVPVRIRDMQIMLGLFLGLSVIYCYLIFQNLRFESLTSSDNSFSLPIWLLIISFIIPYLYIWFVGLVAAYDFYRLATHTAGVLYRQAFRLFAYGFGVVIASSISVQYLRSVLTRRGGLSLNKTLIIIYVIYLLIGVGFVLISLGANRLKKIEEV